MVTLQERLRDRAFNRVKSILKFSQTITDTTTIEAITIRLEYLDIHFQSVNQNELELLTVSEDYEPITKTVNETYHQARMLLMQASLNRRIMTTDPVNLNENFENSSQPPTCYEGNNTNNNPCFPAILIEPFAGNYQYWPVFYKSYTSTVHNNNDLNNVDKFHILTKVLKDDAVSLIRHIRITEANYNKAWDLLCKRYNKRNRTVNSRHKSFFNQKPWQYSNENELPQIAENSDEFITCLRKRANGSEVQDYWHIYLILKNIDMQACVEQTVNKNILKVSAFITFLNVRYDELKIWETTRKTLEKVTIKNSFTNSHGFIISIICECDNLHLMHKCHTFKNLSIEAREKIVTKIILYRNCLQKGLTCNKCTNHVSCLIYNKLLHSLLHYQIRLPTRKYKSTSTHHAILNQHSHDQSSQSFTKPPPTIELNQIDTRKPTSQAYHTHLSTTTTVLPTIVIHILSRTGKLQPFRALLDSGSQTSFVTESCAQSLNLVRHSSSLSIYGLASTPAGYIKEKINMTISSRFDPAYKLSIKAHIINKIANLLPTNLIKYPSNLIKNLNLADSQFFRPNTSDVLLGADVFFEIVNPEKLIIKDVPPLQYSKFGWLVAGNLENQTQPILIPHATTESSNQHQTDDVSNQTTQFIRDTTTDLSKQPTYDNNSNVSKESTDLNIKVKTDLRTQTTAVNHNQPSVPDTNGKLSTKQTSYTTYHGNPNCRTNLIDVHSKFPSIKKCEEINGIIRLMSPDKVSSSITSLFSSFQICNIMDNHKQLQITNHERPQSYCITHSDKHESDDVYQPNQFSLKDPVTKVHCILTHQNVKTSRTTIAGNQYADAKEESFIPPTLKNTITYHRTKITNDSEIRRKSRWKENKIPVKQSYAIRFQRLVIEPVHRKAKSNRKIKLFQLTRLSLIKHHNIPDKIWCKTKINFKWLRKTLQHLIPQLIIDQYDNLLMCIFPLQKFTVSLFRTSDNEYITKFHSSCSLPEEDTDPAQPSIHLENIRALMSLKCRTNYSGIYTIPLVPARHNTQKQLHESCVQFTKQHDTAEVKHIMKVQETS